MCRTGIAATVMPLARSAWTLLRMNPKRSTRGPPKIPASTTGMK